MKVRVAQMGARKGYAVVRALARHRALESLCTDFYFRGAFMQGLAKTCDALGARRRALTLRSRFCTDAHDQLVRTFPLTGLINHCRVRLASGSGVPYGAHCRAGRAFASSVSQLPWKGVDLLYGFSSACLEAFQRARKEGVLCILDHETAPAALESALVRHAEEIFPEWLPYSPRAKLPGLAEYAERQQAEAELADLVICPSSFGARLVQVQGISVEKLRTIPFSMGEDFIRRRTQHDGPLRVLFAGHDAVRKGLPVLVRALKLLPNRLVEARGAGRWELSAYGWNECRKVMQPLGAVPRNQMAALYEWADVFVLPTFSDTMGVVILEAMSCGVPVITTHTSGGPDLIRSGIDGLIIASSAEALSMQLIELSRDRDTLLEMSENAYARSRDHTLEKYGDRLLMEIMRETERRHGRIKHLTPISR